MLTITKRQSELFQREALNSFAHELVGHLTLMLPQPWREFDAIAAVARATQFIDVALHHGLERQDDIERFAEVLTLAPSIDDDTLLAEVAELVSQDAVIAAWPDSADIIAAMMAAPCTSGDVS